MIYYPKPLNFYGPFKKYKENFKNLKILIKSAKRF